MPSDSFEKFVEGELSSNSPRVIRAREFRRITRMGGHGRRQEDDNPIRMRDSLGMHFAYTDEPDQTCKDGLPLEACEAAQSAIVNAQNAAHQSEHLEEEGSTWTTYAWALGSKCVACTVNCNIEAAVLVTDGQPTEVTRLAFFEPDDSMPTMVIDIDQ